VVASILHDGKVLRGGMRLTLSHDAGQGRLLPPSILRRLSPYRRQKPTRTPADAWFFDTLTSVSGKRRFRLVSKWLRFDGRYVLTVDNFINP
jgi:hypothetical protein